MTLPTETLLALAGRVESATGADAALDREIMEALVACGTMAFRVAPANFRVTASLDAAMTLVPEGWTYTFECTGNADEFGVDLYAPPEWDRVGWSHQAASMPLAIVAAAIRARAASGVEG